MDNIAIAWYKKEEYDKLLKVIIDKGSMPSNYNDWFEIATATIEDLKNQGFDVKKIVVDVDELIEWCRVMKKENTAKNRALFVSLRAKN